MRLLVQHDNVVAIHNALLVDPTGRVASETFGPRICTGVGGQTSLMIAAQYSRAGRSLVSVAHPDFRAELREQAASLYGVSL